jgi:hypothetical protein
LRIGSLLVAGDGYGALLPRGDAPIGRSIVERAARLEQRLVNVARR